MMVRYIYMKFIGFLLVVLGFSYSMTSFYNFYEYIFGNITIASSNILVMMIGLLVPLYMLIFGIYFYFYADKNITSINKYIMCSAIAFLIIGIVCLILKSNFIYNYLFVLSQVFEFLHVSCGYVLVLLGAMIIYGCVKYKY